MSETARGASDPLARCTAVATVVGKAKVEKHEDQIPSPVEIPNEANALLVEHPEAPEQFGRGPEEDGKDQIDQIASGLGRWRATMTTVRRLFMGVIAISGIVLSLAGQGSRPGKVSMDSCIPASSRGPSGHEARIDTCRHWACQATTGSAFGG